MDRLRRIGKYDLDEALGSGGMATVYRGRDPDLQRDVAVKVLHPHLCSREESRLRFRREARAVARLKHPAILEVYEAGEDNGRPFIVSELILGGSLDAWATARRPIPAEIVAVIGLRTAEGLHAAHQAGIIHRDLKPGNILMGVGGKVKVADFGIAQILDIEHLTSTGQILGSPAFMSPEHLEGARLDARADVFSFGTLLYWLATGELPFSGPNPHAVLRKVLDVDYPDPARVRPEIGEVLAGVIRVCLERKPEDRYATMADVASALRAVLNTAGVTNPGERIAAFEKDPEGQRKALLENREKALLARCHDLEKTPAAAAEIRRLCSWILAWQPEHKEALRLVEATMVRRSVRRLVVAVLVAAVLAVSLTLFFSLRSPAPPSSDASAADAVVAAVDASAPEREEQRRRDAGGTASPQPAAVETVREDGGPSEDVEEPDVGDAPPGELAEPDAPEVGEQLPDATAVPPADAGPDGAAAAAGDGRTDAAGAREAVRPDAGWAQPAETRTVKFSPRGACGNFEIWVDGAHLGTYGPAPGITSATLTTGEHRFAFRPSATACIDAEWAETIPPGDGPYDLIHILRLRPAELVVDTGGAAAQVIVLNRANGGANEAIEVPFEPQDSTEETVTVGITFPGHAQITRSVRLRAGESTTIRVDPPAPETDAG